MRMKRSTKTLVLMGLGGMFLSMTGCIVERQPREVYVAPAGPPPQPAYVEGDQYGDEVVTAEPPQPLAEPIVGVAPGPDYLWIPGVYVWIDGVWRWHRGYWGRPPHPGAHFEAYRWERGEHGWVRRGGWR